MLENLTQWAIGRGHPRTLPAPAGERPQAVALSGLYTQLKVPKICTPPESQQPRQQRSWSAARISAGSAPLASLGWETEVQAIIQDAP